MDWVHSFYDTQDTLTGCYGTDVHPFHHAQAARVTGHRGAACTLLELGAGGGQFAVAAAQAGHAVTALDLRASATAHTTRLAEQHGVPVHACTGDFYTVDLGRTYDMVVYWDGFGIGEDADQAALLHQVAQWLEPHGTAFVEVFTPWYWAQHAGFTRNTDTYMQTYGFDARRCRLLDTYTPVGGEAITQSLRCYSPEDLCRLLPEGLVLAEVWPGGAYDTRALTWHSTVPLGQCQSFTAVLQRP